MQRNPPTGSATRATDQAASRSTRLGRAMPGMEFYYRGPANCGARRGRRRPEPFRFAALGGPNGGL